MPRSEATAAVEVGQTVILPENDVWESSVVLTVNKRALREDVVEFEGIVPENPLELVEFFSFLGSVEPDWDKAQLAMPWTGSDDYDLEPSGLYWPGYATDGFKIGHDETEGYIGANKVAWMEHSADGTIGEHAYVKMDNAGTVVVRGIYYTENWNAFNRIKDATIWVYYNDVPVWKQYAAEELPTWHALFVSGKTGMCTRDMGGTVTSPTLEDLVNAGVTAQASKLPAPEQIRSAAPDAAA